MIYGDGDDRGDNGLVDGGGGDVGDCWCLAGLKFLPQAQTLNQMWPYDCGRQWTGDKGYKDCPPGQT